MNRNAVQIMSHHIRLGPPWDVAAEADGRTRHARRFGRPTNLGAERVHLVAELPAGSEVLLNGAALDSTDVTDRLLPRNELVILVPSDAAITGIALEIR